MKKKIGSLAIVLALCMSQIGVYADWNISEMEYSEILAYVNSGNQEDPIKIIINSQEIPFDQAPIFAEDNTLLVPVRAIAEGLGQNVEWNQGDQTIIVQRGTDTSVFQIGNKRAYSDEIIPLETEARIVNDRTLIPLKSISDIFEADSVTYDKSKNAVVVECSGLDDEDIMLDFRRFGFNSFDYFSNTFIDEHMSGSAEIKYAFLNIASQISDWGSKIVLGQLGDYEKDAYKKSISKILSNVVEEHDISLSDAWEKDILQKIEKASNITYDELKQTWEKEWPGQTFELSNWDEAAIGKSLKTFNDELGKINNAIEWTELTAKEIGYILADYSQQQMYIDIIDKSTFESDISMKEAVSELQTEYASGMARALTNIQDTLKSEIENKLSGKIISSGLKLIGKSASTIYDVSTFAIEKGVDVFGGTKYAENVESAIMTMGIANNLRLYTYELLHKNYSIATDTISPNATKKTWNEFKSAFEITRAALIEAYKCMIEVTDDPIERIYLKEQLNLLGRIRVSSTLPTNAADMFSLDMIVENPTIEGSSPGVVTSDGTYVYFALNGYIYREKLDGGERTPIYKKVYYEDNGKKYYEQYKYEDLQYSNGHLYAYGEKTGAFGAMSNSLYGSVDINLSDLSIVYSASEGVFTRRDIGNTDEIADKFFIKPYNYQKYLDNIWFKHSNIIPSYTYSLYVSTSEGRMVRIIDEVDQYCVYNGYIYYINDGVLYRKDLNWYDTQTLSEKLPVSGQKCRINIVGDWIYLEETPDMLSVYGHLYRAEIGEYIFEEVIESEADKNLQTNNIAIDNSSNADNASGDTSIKNNTADEKNTDKSSTEGIDSIYSIVNDVWESDAQGRDSVLHFTFKSNGTANVTVGEDSNTIYTTSYEFLDNETILLKWDLSDWENHIIDNTVTSDMPTTTFKYKHIVYEEYNIDNYILESTQVFDDPLEGTYSPSLHREN